MGVSEESKGKMKQVLSDIRVASRPTVGPEPVKVFVSYSQEDLDLVTVLDHHLTALRREGLISLWIDRQIGPGEEWREAIDQNISDAAIILLMISSSFIASEYCWDVELQQALERHAAGSARVIPVILRDCDWQHLPFSKLQALPTAACPIVKWPDPDSGFADVSRGIRKAVLALRD